MLLQVGLKGYEIAAERRPPANLVFLIDVSGSMQDPDKLPLLKNAFRLLTRQLKAADRVALVVYAGAAGAVLEPTPGNEQARILAALDQLEAGGSTNGAGGIRLAYDLARQAFIKGGINRIVLATDGDFNVGTTDFDALIDIVERERDGGVSLTTLGFGTGNYNDELLEQLADAGNGNYAYIDTLNEGRKVLVEQLSGTLQTIAKDVKIQVEFNPAVVAEYRLIGYENRVLAPGGLQQRQDRRGRHRRRAHGDCAVRAHADRQPGPAHGPAALWRGGSTAGDRAATWPRSWPTSACATRRRTSDKSLLIEQPVRRADIRVPWPTCLPASPVTCGSPPPSPPSARSSGAATTSASFGYDAIARLAAGARGDDPGGYRGEFVVAREAGRQPGAGGRRSQRWHRMAPLKGPRCDASHSGTVFPPGRLAYAAGHGGRNRRRTADDPVRDRRRRGVRDAVRPPQGPPLPVLPPSVRQSRDWRHELFQEVWVRIIKARERYEPKARFTTYMYQIAHNCLVDHFRKSGRSLTDGSARGTGRADPGSRSPRSSTRLRLCPLVPGGLGAGPGGFGPRARRPRTPWPSAPPACGPRWKHCPSSSARHSSCMRKRRWVSPRLPR